ncbi:ferredoxin reductase [Aerolutibacter ruishenii]|uniref:Ferredoxin-NADP reductase n=1 Tax=Aerolutibacter ruishenii TaxID=686800 RepID=A0A562M2Z8_9GAMM|nr:ferredoxin reductase [Lysobacter ruishenii]TWI14327.1 ferredoxin-NADP reductase [Lysobacter ruishenii]
MSAVRLPPATRRPGRLRRWAKAWVSPAFIDFWASHLDPTWSLERPLARIVGRRQESHDAVTLLLAPNRHWRGFAPGQHLSLGAEVEGARISRSYSLSDLLRADGRLSVTVRHVPGGKLSTHLCHHARVGEVLELGPAFGEMTLPSMPTAPLLFLAAGSGITPLMAHVRAQAAQGMPVPLTLVYSARTRADLCFAGELRGLAAAHPNFSVHFALTREVATATNCINATLASDESLGRVDEALLAARVPALADRIVFACGPGEFVAHARALLATQVREFQAEAFTPPPRVVEEGGHVQLTLAASGRTLEVPRGMPLLAALEAEGIKPAAGCRMGICNTCACGKRSGTSRDLHTGEATTEPLSALKLCVSSAVSDLVIDL